MNNCHCHDIFLIFAYSRIDYHQLVFQALSLRKTKIKLLPPAIIKPRQMWSGKQILSTVIINIIPEGRALINLTATSKISARVSNVSIIKFFVHISEF